MRQRRPLGVYVPSTDQYAEPAPTAQHSVLMDRWARAIFEAWAPHRNPHDGGVIVVHQLDETRVRARLGWMPHALFVERSHEGKRPPCDVPAHERSASLRPGTPAGDVAWVVFIGPDRKVEHVASVGWPQELDPGGDA